MSQPKQLIYKGLDANTQDAATDWLKIPVYKNVAYQVKGATGSHNTHVIVLDCSLDGVTYSEMSSTNVTGEGIIPNKQIITSHVRARVKTPEGSASTVDIIIQAK